MTTSFGWCLDGLCDDCKIHVGESACGHPCHTEREVAA